jgi:hypothetical protein
VGFEAGVGGGLFFGFEAASPVANGFGILGPDFGEADEFAFGRMSGLEAPILPDVKVKVFAAYAALAQTVRDIVSHCLASKI